MAGFNTYDWQTPKQSPILDQYNQDGIVTPQLQQALDMARLKLPQVQLPGAQPPAGPTPLMRNLAPPMQSTPAIQRPDVAQGGLAAPGQPQQAPSLSAPAMPRISDAAQSHLDNYNRLTNVDPSKGPVGSGIDQVKNPILRGLLRIPEALGSTFLPSLTSYIPGTGLHHEGLVKGNEAVVNQDTANAKENATTAETEARTAAIPTETALKEAQTENLVHPPKGWKESAEPAVDPDHPELGPQHVFYNESDPTQRKFGGTMAAKPTEGKESENTHVLPDGTVIAVHNDPKTGKSTAEVVYQGKPTEKPGHVIQRMVNGKLRNILIDPETGQDRADVGEAKQPTPADHGITGTAGGKVVRLEPGQATPEGFTTLMQAGANNAADAKGLKSAQESLKYGQDYLKTGKFTGPGDEALMEAYFDVAKPSSGFRMSQPQIDMLLKARSWMESAEGLAYHAKTGVWFPDQQRQQIVDAMAMRAASKGNANSGAAQGGYEIDHVYGGMTYLGGDPKVEANWKKKP